MQMNAWVGEDYFALFGLARAFRLDLQALASAYRGLLDRCHPDRFARASDAERRRALENATYVNHAYVTLRRPLERARYLLELEGVDCLSDRFAAEPPEFLVEQMQWREAIEAARNNGDCAGLREIGRRLDEKCAALESELVRLLDEDRDFNRAAKQLRMLSFLEAIRRDLGRLAQTLGEADAV